MALDNLTPVIRPEKILNGDAIEPVTRKEYFIQKAASGGGGGGEGVFPVELIYDESTDSLRSSKTSTEIISAFRLGSLPYLFSDEEGSTDVYSFIGITDSHVLFAKLTSTIVNNSITGLVEDFFEIDDVGMVFSRSGSKTF